MDRISLLTPYFVSGKDIKLSGFVSYVGKSSMEVSLRIEVCEEGVEAAIEKSIADRKKGCWPVDLFGKQTGETIILAKFTMVYKINFNGLLF